MDVLFNTTANDTMPPSLTARRPLPNATAVATTPIPTATFSEPVQQATISFVLRDPSNNVVPAALTYNAGTQVATLTPSANLAANTSYTVTVSGAKDLSGNSMSPVTWTFTTGAPWARGRTLSGRPASAPAVDTDSDSAATEIGVKFRTDVAGTINAIRFYKGPTKTGTHIGDLWSSTGRSSPPPPSRAKSATGGSR